MSLCSRVQELQLWKPMYPKAGALLQKPLQWETHTPQVESIPYSLKLEKAFMQQ